MLTSKLAHTFYFLFIIVISLVLFPFRELEFIYKENGLLENLQALCLALSCLIFFVAGLRLQLTLRYVVFFFSWLSFVFLLRELDIEKLDVPNIVIMFGAGKGRAIFLIPLFAVMFYIVKNSRHYLVNFKVYLFSAMSAYIVLSALFLIASWPFDKALIDIPHRVFIEETVELAGYYFLTIAAIISSVNLKQLKFKTS